MLSVIVLNVTMVSVVMLNVVMVSVIAHLYNCQRVFMRIQKLGPSQV
jgi:hypothetical protein